MASIPLPTFPKLITDQAITTEEYHASIVVPSRSIPTQSSNLRSSQRHKTSSLLKEVISDQLESIIQAGLGVGDSDSLDCPSVSVDLSIKKGHGEKEGTNSDASHATSTSQARVVTLPTPLRGSHTEG
jgi:hypothetical protein